MNEQEVKPPSSDPDVASLDSEGVQQLKRLDKHHIKLRWCAIVIAVLIILATGYLEFVILDRLDDWKELGNLIVLLGIAPILSITIIVTFILIGAFKQPGDTEISLPGLLQAVQSLSGTQN